MIAVLLQPGKTDAGALFTSGVSSAAMNPRGTASVLSKLTIAAATIFMLSALMLSLPAVTGNVSVLQTQGDTPSTTAPGANSNTADANSATESNSNSNAEQATEANTEESEKPEEKPEESSSDAAKTEKDADSKEEESKKDDSSDEK